MVGLILASLSVLMQAGAVPGSDGVLDARQLQSAVRSIDTFKPRDTFSVPPDQTKLHDQQFRLELPLPHDQMPGWLYNPIDRELRIITMPTFRFTASRLPKGFEKSAPSIGGEGWAFFDSATSRSQYSASNAFGVVARVTSEIGRTYGVVPIGGTGFNADPEWEVVLSMTPQEARAVAPRLRLRVLGTIQPVAGSQAVACYDDLLEATLTSPREYMYRKCLVGAQIDAVSVVDNGTGKALKRWTRPGFEAAP